MSSSVLDPVRDPHCGRGTVDRIEFKVHGEIWDTQWGSYDTIGTAAFWIDQTVRGRYAERVADIARGTDIAQEVVFCLLGGFGVSAESALAAYNHIESHLAAHPEPCAETLEALLRQPLPDGRGRYRFPRQRSQRISASLRTLLHDPPPREPHQLRDYLLQLNGVGPKTAAWIVRNVTGSAQIAIVDIWLVRALTSNRIFKPEWRVDRDYGRYESAFLQYAAHGDVEPAALDLCIWEQARIIGASYFETRQRDT